MIDLFAIVREACVDAAKPLYAQAGTRVYGINAPKGFINTQKAVVFNFTGGAPDAYVTDFEAEAEFRCFGGSADPLDALAVSGALHDTLHAATMERQSSGMLMGALETTQPVVLRDPDTEWYFVFCQFTLLLRGNS